MRSYTFRIVFTLSVVLSCTGCNNSKQTDLETGQHLTSYALAKDWPQLPKTFPFTRVSAGGVDTSQNILILQRGGREFKYPLPDSLISVNTVFILEKETGKLLKSWGANLFIMPHGLNVDRENNVWITDVGLNQVFKFNHEGTLLLKLGVAKTEGNDSTHFNLPTDVAVARDGSFYVSDGYGNSRVVKFSKDGKYLLQWGKMGKGPGEFNIPHSIRLDSKGDVFVADRENNRVQKFDDSGKFLREWKNDRATVLYALTVNKEDHVFAVDYIYEKNGLIGNDIIQLDSELNLIHRAGRSDATADTSALFHDVAVDNHRNLFVANIWDRKVQKFKPISKK